MVALIEGTKAPTFSLNSLEGTRYSLQEALRNDPVVLIAFLKVSCPVCHLEFPYLERLHRGYPSAVIWGISQDDSDATRSFAKMFGVTFPILLDESLDTSVSYQLTHVPSLFLIGKDLTIKQSSVGFVKSDLVKLNELLAESLEQPLVPLFTEADEVPALRPGCMAKQPA